MLHIFEHIDNIFDFYMFTLCSKTHLRCGHSILISGTINGYIMKDVVVFVESFLWHFVEYIENIEWPSLTDIWHRSDEQMAILDIMNIFCHNLMTINGIECDIAQIKIKTPGHN